jgi:hypothetical protein
MDQENVKPWHMWGSEQTVQVPAGGATTQSAATPQLARVNYKRPETWTFFFVATLLQGVSSGATQAVFVAFDLTLGVGRSSTTVAGFRTFNINWTVTPPVNQQFFASTAPNVTGTNAPGTDGFVDSFPASEIQCTARCIVPATSGAVVLTVGAYFSPRTHIRPDWYGGPDDPLFNGERGGR